MKPFLRRVELPLTHLHSGKRLTRIAGERKKKKRPIKGLSTKLQTEICWNLRFRNPSEKREKVDVSFGQIFLQVAIEKNPFF